MADRSVMHNGLTVISEFRPGFPALALSLTLRGGSAAETVRFNGIHHMLEHLVFKGSRRYSPRDIAVMTDRLGGRLNAFTGREITQYHIAVLDEQAGAALDLLTDMVFYSRLPEEEMQREREVVLQEIRESDDDPESRVFSEAFLQFFGARGYGLPITGTLTSVGNMGVKDLQRGYRRWYRPENMILAATGNLEHQRLLDMAAERIPGGTVGEPASTETGKPGFTPVRTGMRLRSLQQAYVVIAMKGLRADHPDRYAYSMMNDILGGGVSSRLFQAVRETRGIAYTVYSFFEAFRRGGIHFIYAVMDPSRVDTYLRLVAREVARLRRDGVDAEELERARDQLKSSLVLGLEDNLSRMQFHVHRELAASPEADETEIMEKANRVTGEDLNRVLRRHLDPGAGGLFVYGPGDPRRWQTVPLGEAATAPSMGKRQGL